MMLSGQIGCLHIDDFVAEDRTRDFGNRVRQIDKRLCRRALLRRNIRCVQILRLRTVMIATIGTDGCHRAEIRNSRLVMASIVAELESLARTALTAESSKNGSITPIVSEKRFFAFDRERTRG